MTPGKCYCLMKTEAKHALMITTNRKIFRSVLSNASISCDLLTICTMREELFLNLSTLTAISQTSRICINTVEEQGFIVLFIAL